LEKQHNVTPRPALSSTVETPTGTAEKAKTNVIRSFCCNLWLVEHSVWCFTSELLATQA